VPGIRHSITQIISKEKYKTSKDKFLKNEVASYYLKVQKWIDLIIQMFNDSAMKQL
jgi:hypothetical protein